VAVEIRIARSPGSPLGAIPLREAKSWVEFGHLQRRMPDLSIRLGAVRIWTGWDSSLGLEEGVGRLAAELDDFLGTRDAEGPNTLVVCFATPAIGTVPSYLVRDLLQILRLLSDGRPVRNRQPRITESGWRFRYAGVDMDVDVFAPCFGPGDPRHTFGLESTFLLFRPLLLGPAPPTGLVEGFLGRPFGPGFDLRLVDPSTVAA
jgi:hypothetical protein